jgi:hypothetical protein
MSSSSHGVPGACLFLCLCLINVVFIFMLAPLNSIIPDIATKNKVAKTNDFCGSLLLLAINVQELLEMINKPNTSFSFIVSP